MRLHVTENKSVDFFVKFNTVRVFVDNDYTYGYWISEEKLAAHLGLTDPDKAKAYLAKSEFKTDVSIDIAKKIVEDGATPFEKVKLV